ncbi:hypothetical protein PMY38_17125 [Clostridium tertium]|uniref:Uncharacterized protein n=2 Tax=Clostridiaceae TaxID=31979 RepID=A0A9X3XIH3_9CLOT|nr:MULTISPECIES: hypothetical protein [Clostridium]EEH96529.2 hypothetical protein CSBG_00155 [Clostridium sp. 7_2_43FAA]MDB1955134.1 hypothetical protein [Clostridium tertium]MDB1960325.1 hypothetical protein [Clostridium tertium]MDB1964129.1 hypothetical protein [Clostridium tertium]MDB1965924.1 hypothetical protein [Clostridium tertium]
MALGFIGIIIFLVLLSYVIREAVEQGVFNALKNMINGKKMILIMKDKKTQHIAEFFPKLLTLSFP